MQLELGYCKGENCGYYRYIVNKKYYLCQECNHKRLHGETFKQKMIRKAEKPKRKKTGERKVFNEIWNEREHKSEISDRDLDSFSNYLFENMFAHILDKKNYPKFRLNKNNILLVHPFEHTLIDQGTIKERKEYEKEYNCSFQIFFNEKEKLKQAYANES